MKVVGGSRLDSALIVVIVIPVLSYNSLFKTSILFADISGSGDILLYGSVSDSGNDRILALF